MSESRLPGRTSCSAGYREYETIFRLFQDEISGYGCILSPCFSIFIKDAAVLFCIADHLGRSEEINYHTRYETHRSHEECDSVRSLRRPLRHAFCPRLPLYPVLTVISVVFLLAVSIGNQPGTYNEHRTIKPPDAIHCCTSVHVYHSLHCNNRTCLYDQIYVANTAEQYS